MSFRLKDTKKRVGQDLDRRMTQFGISLEEESDVKVDIFKSLKLYKVFSML